jgi:hypothetical protein
MGASWLKNYLAPVQFLVNSIAQFRDNRVNFRNGFTASQVLDADGLPVLTIDSSVSSTSYEPTASTIPIRNGSGTLKGATITALSFTYSTAKEISRFDPILVSPDFIDPATGWTINSAREPQANAIGIEWANEIKPPVGSSLKSIKVEYTPAGAHVGLPNDQPAMILAVVIDGVVTPYETAVQDNAATVLAYEAKRTLTKTFATPLVINVAHRYIVLFENEESTNALAGLKLHQPAGWTADVVTL